MCLLLLDAEQVMYIGFIRVYCMYCLLPAAAAAAAAATAAAAGKSKCLPA